MNPAQDFMTGLCPEQGHRHYSGHVLLDAITLYQALDGEAPVTWLALNMGFYGSTNTTFVSAFNNANLAPLTLEPHAADADDEWGRAPPESAFVAQCTSYETTARTAGIHRPPRPPTSSSQTSSSSSNANNAYNGSSTSTSKSTSTLQRALPRTARPSVGDASEAMVYSPPSPSLPTLSCSPLGGRGGGGLNEDLFAYKWSNDPREGMGYDVCVSRVPRDGAAPGLVYLRVVEDYSVMLDGMRDGQVQADNDGEGLEGRRAFKFPRVVFTPCGVAEFKYQQHNERQQRSDDTWLGIGCIPVCGGVAGGIVPFPPLHTCSLIPESSPLALNLLMESAGPAPSPAATPAPPPRTQSLTVLIYISDGYMESSLLALNLCIGVHRLTLLEA
ncbi:hypothetical protein B0H14DRAFT_3463904 [Mycena olivaceomarginata]|nr:hypothetical protein B0H14DRAFT_3463904 [Mycena olivaceomarginata]